MLKKTGEKDIVLAGCSFLFKLVFDFISGDDK
jgi:hypothetical protein